MTEGVQIFTLNADDQTSTVIALQLTQAPHHAILRLTGGFGKMAENDGIRAIELLSKALADFNGAMLYGGTRVLRRSNPSVIVPTLGEVPYRVRLTSPSAKILGIIPRVDIFRIVPGLGMVISEEPSLDQITVVHPEQDIGLQVQKNVDDLAPWDAEWKESLRIVDHLVKYAGWRHVLLSYNGGEVTRREITAWSNLSWPVLLVSGGGRVTDELANDKEWLRSHPSVVVAESSISSVREALTKSGILKGD